MSNGDDTLNNCILEICCGGPDSKQGEALAEQLEHHAGLNKHQATETAAWLIATYDFAMKGTLKPLKDSIAAFARGNPYIG